MRHRLTPFALLAFAGLYLLRRQADAEATSGGPQSRFATVNGLRLHYLIAGKGPAIVLLHGFGEDSRMWRPLIPELAKNHTVIAPDLRGSGQSDRPAAGYDKKTLAQDIHTLTDALGFSQVELVGHDIGLMVAYAYAAQYPAQVRRLVLLDAFLPGVGAWKDIWLAPDLWHFHFFGETALKLVTRRERIYLEHFWNDFAMDPEQSISEADRRRYAATFAQSGAVRAGMEYFRAFPSDAEDFETFARRKLAMPVLVVTGEKSGPFLIEQARLIANDVRGEVIPGSGHWLMEEAPEQVIPLLMDFLGGEPAAVRERLIAETQGTELASLQ